MWQKYEKVWRNTNYGRNIFYSFYSALHVCIHCSNYVLHIPGIILQTLLESHLDFPALITKCFIKKTTLFQNSATIKYNGGANSEWLENYRNTMNIEINMGNHRF